MTVTNDERREVAAKLRGECFSVNFAFDCLLSATLGEKKCDVDDCENCRETIINRLAALIEPEPERTCRWEHIEGTWFMSECGKRYDRVVPDNYCPNCGARVID